MVVLQTLLVFTSLKYKVNNLWANLTLYIKDCSGTYNFGILILCTVLL